MKRFGEIGCRVPALGQITLDDGEEDNDDDNDVDDDVHLSINTSCWCVHLFQVTVYLTMFLVSLCMGTYRPIAHDCNSCF